MPKQNPFSVYDFLGYFTPGALFLYGWLGLSVGESGTSTFLDAWSFEKAQVLIPFVLVAYTIGHLLSFISSVTVERYSIWAMGYPSKYLLAQDYAKYFDVSKPKGLRIVLRGFVWLLLLPITAADLLLGRWLHFRDLYAKSLDPLFRNVIDRKVGELLSGPASLTPDHVESHDEHDSFRYVYHWTVEHAQHHGAKMQNYVALYGFLRTLTLLAVIAFWATVFAAPFAFAQKHPVYTGLLIALAAYVLFMAFVKFYRRFSLEAYMALAVSFPVKV